MESNEDMQTAQAAAEAQEKLTKRREARRQKVLENAQKRLEKLTGRKEVLIEYENDELFEPTIYPDPEVTPNIPLLHSVLHQEPQLNADDFQQFLETLTAQATGETRAANGSAEEAAPQNQMHPILRHRLHVLIPAAIAYCLSAMELSAFSIFYCSCFCIILELVFFWKPRELSPMTKLVLAFLGIRSSFVNRIVQFSSIFQNLISDIGILIFFICVFSYLLKFINDGFADLIIVN